MVEQLERLLLTLGRGITGKQLRATILFYVVSLTVVLVVSLCVTILADSQRGAESVSWTIVVLLFGVFLWCSAISNQDRIHFHHVTTEQMAWYCGGSACLATWIALPDDAHSRLILLTTVTSVTAVSSLVYGFKRSQLRNSELRDRIVLWDMQTDEVVARARQSGLLASDAALRARLGESIEAARRHFGGEIAGVRRQFAQLSALSSSVPFIGLAGTVYGILTGLRSADQGIEGLANAIANSLVFTAIALAAALPLGLAARFTWNALNRLEQDFSEYVGRITAALSQLPS
jgi:biopolymer transport protein ExbB/TolQ